MEEVVIASLQVENFEAVVRAQMALEGLRKEAKDYKAQLDANVISEEEYVRLMAENTAATVEQKNQLASLNKDIKTNTALNKAASGSIDEMRAQVAKLTKEYTALSKEERDSPAGKALKAQIKDLNDELKNLEGGYGDFRRNVGNYTNGVLDALGSISPQIQQTVDLFRNVGPQVQQGFGAAKDAVKNFGAGLKGASGGIDMAKKSMVALGRAALVNPFGILLLAVVGLITYLTKFDGALDGIEQALAGLSASMTPLIDYLGQIGKNVIGLFTTIGEILSELGSAIKNAVTMNMDEAAKAMDRAGAAMGRLKDQTVNLIPSTQGLGDAMALAYQQAAAMTARIQDLEDAESHLAFSRLRIEKQIAQLEKASEDRSKSGRARLDALNKARGLAIDLAKEESDLQKQRNRETINAILIDTKLNNLVKESGEFTSLEVEAIEQKIKALADSKNLIGQLPDIMEKLTAAQKSQLDAEQALTDVTLKYNAASGRLVKQQQADNEARVKSARAAYMKLLELQVEIAGNEQETATARKRLLEEQLKDELKEAGKNRALRLAIQKKYDLEYMKIDKELADALFEQRKKDSDRKEAADKQDQDYELSELEKAYRLKDLAITKSLADGAITAENAEAARLEAQGEYLQALLAMQQKFGVDTIATEEQISKAKIDVVQKEKAKRQKLEEAQMQITRNVVNSVAAAVQLMGENSSDALAFQKMLALANIGIKTAEAIAGVTAAAATFSKDPVTFFVTLTSGIATVLSNIVQATSILNSTNEPQAPTMQKFQRGGLVGGNLHSAGGTLIEAERGEMVMTRGAVSMFGGLLSQLNAAGGGQGMSATIDASRAQQQMMLNSEQSLANAMKSLPNPIVNTRDIARTDQDSYRTKNRASIGVVNRSASMNP